MRFTALKRFVEKRAPVERCELCAAPLASVHAHLVEPLKRKILCACEPCAMLFDQPECRLEARTTMAGGKYRRVPRDVRVLSDFQMTDDQWQRLDIPIDAAFFFSSPAQRVVALYPSAAGAVESLLGLSAWEELAAANPVLRNFEPDVEALLVNRIKNAREYFRAPIDECYRFTGLIRGTWRGFSGGAEVWGAIDRFFAELRARGQAG